ncbi:MAG TPA: SLAP domain-containing protein [Bacillus sp. (in: firmicutes)]|uniref:SLAP domain-containing protein n=1 Tax=Bacillus litorisediminis TaxID=2922713 RepID=UPI001FAC6FFE|nr:SLAP domain-containing protein [Bacillus litorisediminis]HWO77344.1 SLAP domain-containing protein [Bacillus sp. (in: firmicutes)]
MQTLKFESSWDKTISAKDRQKIEHVFKNTSISKHTSIEFTPLWQAVNYKGELLVTVLVQNFSKHPQSFHNKKLRYAEDNEMVAEHLFTLPALVIEPETSMPWTFIFPAESLRQPMFKTGYLELI